MRGGIDPEPSLATDSFRAARRKLPCIASPDSWQRGRALPNHIKFFNESPPPAFRSEA